MPGWCLRGCRSTSDAIHNDRLIDALMTQAFAALNASPGARAFYDDLRARGIEHNDALRRLATGSSASCTDA